MANTNINIPEKINVGFVNRQGTYTGKLAYIIYYDNKGKLRKETSWNNWRDEKIPNEEYENVPTEGFVLNKKAGGYSTGWNHRQTYVRVYDPRGFEFEITVENLLFILDNTSSIIGKGLEGEFVYGWDGKDLVLIPATSPDYKEIVEANGKRKNARKFTAKDMIVGATYQNKDLEEIIFIGRFDYHDYDYGSRLDLVVFDAYQDVYKKKGKRYWFAQKSTYQWGDKKGQEYYHIFNRTSLTDYLIDVVDENPHEDYAFIFDDLQKLSSYSPPDYSKNILTELEYSQYKERVDYVQEYEHRSVNFTIIKNGVESLVDNKYIPMNSLVREEFYVQDGQVCLKKVNPKRQSYYWGALRDNNDRNEPYYIYENFGTIEEFYNKYKPMKVMMFLENGKKYREVF